MDKFPLELVSVNFTKTIVEAIPNYEPSNESTIQMAPKNTITAQALPKQESDVNAIDRRVFHMKTVMNPEKLATSPYFIEIECFAIFKVVSDIPELEITKALTITGHSVVYGAIREAVSWLTGRHVNGGLFLGLSILTPQSKEEPASN